MLSYIKIENNSDIEKFVKLASSVWHEYFPFLLSSEQINYMLDKFQSFEVVKKQQEQGYEYYFILREKEIVGYCVYCAEEDYLFLSKLYFTKENRSKGYGRQTLNHLKNITSEKGLKKIQLTVNKYNENSIKAYQKWGFKIIEAKVFDIGQGYVMDDYIMEILV